ncbi:hypothetical protein CHARACLAT_008100 [Characodon lateralis]|uniref:Uncharacterized protein n=1 Tax=Characodon lateralis TaxID=208331 RepID=A0ABU7CWK0_9TELE|nr:hypothetical protein [Characodon lateralis]
MCVGSVTQTTLGALITPCTQSTDFPSDIRSSFYLDCSSSPAWSHKVLTWKHLQVKRLHCYPEDRSSWTKERRGGPRARPLCCDTEPLTS